MKTLGWTLVLAVAAALAPIGSSQATDLPDDLIVSRIQFDVTGTDLIPGVAAIRASCAVDASGEPLALLANETIRSTLAVAPGPCSIVLVLLGIDVGLPIFNTTPLGRSSFFIPGVATATLGLVDVTIDLVASLNSTSRVASEIAFVTPEGATWPSWGAHRIRVQAVDGIGGAAETSLITTFTYTLSLALTVYALSVEVYHIDFTSLGSFVGRPSLVSVLLVDLRPHALTLSPPTDVSSDRATFTWTGTIDDDVDHLELRLSDGSSEVAYLLPPSAERAEAATRPSTHYEARIVSIDAAGQESSSNVVEFDSLGPSQVMLGPQGETAWTWALVALAVFAGVVGFAAGALRRRERR